jgi:uncharacterized membrane protein
MLSNKKPRINIQPTPVDKALDLAGTILLIVMWCAALYIFIKLPSEIPTHYNASGEVDDYGNKAMFLILPIIAAITFFVLTRLKKFPHIFNYPVKITAYNAEKQYRIATRMIRFLKLSILLVVITIMMLTYLTTIGVTNGLGKWFVPGIIGLFLMPGLFALANSLKTK